MAALYLIPNGTECISYQKIDHGQRWCSDKFIVDSTFSANELIGIEDDFYQFKRSIVPVIYFVKSKDVKVL
jgi:hypothetical protein